MDLASTKNAEKMEIPEIFYKKDTMYEITIAPADVQQFIDRESKLLREVRFTEKFKSILKSTSSFDYYLIPEISEPKAISRSKSYPRLHYHGIIKINNVQDFLLRDILKFYASCDIQINEYRPEYWPRYITKQREVIDYTTLKKLCNYKKTDLKTFLELSGSPFVKGEERS